MGAEPIRLTVLGSGTSMGVPTLGCHCAVCESADPHDRRLRPSLLLSRNGQNVVIDTTPDFRTQALRVGLDRLDAVLLTHCHADHILGFDDLRPYNFRQKTAIPVYGTDDTFRVLRRVFSYVFDNKPTLSAIPSVKLHEVSGPFPMLGIPFIPVPLRHGALEVLRGISLQVRRGEVAAIIGPSGGGKSTFLRCLNGLERFQGGSVGIDGLVPYLSERLAGC